MKAEGGTYEDVEEVEGGRHLQKLRLRFHTYFSFQSLAELLIHIA